MTGYSQRAGGDRARGSRTSLASQLPTFIKGDAYFTAVGKSTKRVRVIEITCPWLRESRFAKSCGLTFIVVMRDWWAADAHKSASCCHCKRTAWKGERP